MSLVFVPTYIKFMGIEAYGLVGFFGTLLAMFSILDLGLSATLNREMARRSVSPELFQTTRDLLRTIEIMYWGMAVLIGVAVVFLSYPISQYWINPGRLSIEDLQQAVMIMGLVIVLRWPFSMYQGGLMGLQRQVLVNIINSVSATFRGVGAVLVLWLVSPTIQAFFLWQIIVSGIETFTMALFLWCRLPSSGGRSLFRTDILRSVWRFAGGMLSINMVSLILMQTDKILLSKLLSLELFGYYMLAWTVASSLYKVISPICSAFYPKFNQLVVMKDHEKLIELYHASCQIVSVSVFPVAMTLLLYSHDVLLIWTGNAEIAKQTSFVLSILVVGTTCNAMMNIPYSVQLAYGWTSLAFWINVVSIVLLIPSLFLLVKLHGVVGAAIVWASLNIGYIILGIRIMHWRLLKGQLFKWYIFDILIPLAAVTATSFVCGIFFNPAWQSAAQVLFMAGMTALSALVGILSAGTIRHRAPQMGSTILENILFQWKCLKQFRAQ